MSRFAFSHLFPLLVLLGALTQGSPSLADQPKATASSTLKHVQPKVLPPAGSEMSLTVELSNPADALRPLRLYVVRDGRPYEQTIREATYNNKEKPIYSFTLSAPIAEMRYQFFLGDAPSPATSKPTTISSAVESQSYTISRPCVPVSVRHNITLNENAVEEIRQESQEVQTLIIRSQAIEEEAIALTQARKSLEAILRLTSGAPTAKEGTNE
jgi:hypothetical protein